MLKKGIFFALLACLMISSGLRAQWVETDSSFLIWDTYEYGNLEFDAFASMGNDFFAGSYNGWGNIYLSTDDGINWTNMTTADTVFAPTIPPVFSLLVDGTNLFAGTEGPDVVLSTDSGRSWLGRGNGLNPSRLGGYTATLAEIGTSLFAGTNAGTGVDCGVYRTVDSGKTWEAVNTGLTDTEIFSLSTIGTNLFAGTASTGVFRSTDNGANWARANAGCTGLITSLAVIGSDLFAGNGNGTGIFLSTDLGISWTAINNGLTDLHVNSLAVSCSNLFACTDSGVFRTTDLGTHWLPMNSYFPTFGGSLGVCGTYLFAGSSPYGSWGVWRLNWMTLAEQLPSNSIGDTLIFCSSANFSFTSRYTGTCRSASLDSVFLSGLDADEYEVLHTNHSATENMPDSSWIIVNPAQAGIRSVTVTARYIDNENNVLDTSFTLTLDVTPSQSLSVYLKPAQLSDTSQGIVPIPIYASSTTGVTSDSISFRLDLRTDLLTPVSITSPVPGAVVSLGDMDDSGVSVTLVFPPGFSILADTLVATVECQVFVTDTNATAITVAGSSPSGSGTNCLSITDSGAETFMLNPECSDPTLIQFLRTGSLPSMMLLFPNPATNVLNLVSPSGAISISDPLGRSYAVPRNGNEMDISTLPSGVYFLSDGVSRAKFVKE